LIQLRGAVKVLTTNRMLERLLSVIGPGTPPSALLHALRALRQVL
jgi:hypothetical protein